MNIVRNLRNFVLRFDLFAATPTLRVRGESAYENFTCGIISLVLIGAFMGIFAGQVLDVIQKAQIQASVNLDDEPDSAKELQNIRFAIGISYISLQELDQYFSLTLQVQKKQPNRTQHQRIPLEKCSRETWSSYGPDFDKYYDPFKIQSKLCIPKDSDFKLYGYEGSEGWNKLVVKIQHCKKKDNPNCKTTDEIRELFEQYGYFQIRLFFVNSVISPENYIPVSTTLQKDVFLSFSRTLGCRGQITLGKYQIETDQSIWPFSDVNVTTGHYIEDFKTYAVSVNGLQTDVSPTSQRSQQYLFLQITKSTLIYTVQRKHQKLDDLLSYIGGLFALIFFVVFFFLGSFNQYRYELMVAEASFTYDQTGQKIRQKDMNILTYVIYSIYDWLRMVGFQLASWTSMKRIQQARQQANQQLDIRLIMKKLRQYQWCLSLLLDKTYLVASQIVKPMTISESKHNRKISQYYDKIMKNKLTDTKYDQIYNTLMLGKKPKYLPLYQIRHQDELIELQESQVKTNYHTSQNDNKNVNLTMENLQKDKVRDKSYYQTQGSGIQQNSTRQKQEQGILVEQQGCLKKCERELQQDYDSDDESAEKQIYLQYRNIVKDQSETAKKIKQRVPQYLRMRFSIENKLSQSEIMEINDRGKQQNKNQFANMFVQLGLQ